MSSGDPSSEPQPEQQEEIFIPVNMAQRTLPPPPPTPKRIEAESKARNSFWRLLITFVIAIGLIVALLSDIIIYYAVYNWTHPDPRPLTSFTKDILLVISSLAAFLLGKGSGDNKDSE
jgi:O-antigen/teichoic acid export membrane protein